jgi:integrase
MSNRSKGARLYWRADREVWEIRDTKNGKRFKSSTGTSCRAEAEGALADYIGVKHRPSGPAQAHELSVSQALAYYLDEHAPTTAAPERLIAAVRPLDAFWGDLPVSAVRGATCRRYAKERDRSPGTIRRELNVLQAALNHCLREGYLLSAPKVTRPPRPPAKERWLTRQEAAWLLRAARRLNRDGRHLADFILCGLYTGSRKQTILQLHMNTTSLTGGHVDTVNGLIYRRQAGKRETNKRQPPARLPSKYLAHLRRQSANGRHYVVQDYAGRRIGDIKTGWARAKALASELAAKHGIKIDLSDVTPHTLKHTSITWALQRGATMWDVAGYFGTSIETIERVYAHHAPDHMKSAVDAMNRRS